MSGLADVLEVTLNPAWWIRNYKTSASLTAYIAKQLDAGEAPEILSECTMRLGDVVLWRGNYPYAYGSMYSPEAVDALPSRVVAYRLRRAEIAALPTPDELIRSALARVGGAS